MQTRPYIIVTPTYCVSAGVRVMHMLCHELNTIGFDARLLLTTNLSPPGEPIVNPALNTPVVNQEFNERGWDALNEEAIVIYPDSIRGNPLGAKRYVLYVLGTETEPAPEDEFRVYYSRSYRHDKRTPAPVLFYLPVDLTLFHPRGAGPREQDMLWLGKGARFCQERPANVVDITYSWPPTRPELAAQLRKTRYLYSYDALSCTNGEAAICGAVVIMKHLSYHDMVWTRADLEYYELGTGGIAFDESPAELDRALRTVHEAFERARYLVATFRHSLLEFADRTQSHFVL